MIEFLKLYRSARSPKRADPELFGAIPIRARRFCHPYTTVSGLGWYFFPPIDFRLVWTGKEFLWQFGDHEKWMRLNRAYLPDFLDDFRDKAPDPCKDDAPAFLEVFPEMGVIQVWSGYSVITPPDCSIWIKGLTNHPPHPSYWVMEAIIETDWWIGPLVSNLQFTETNVPVNFSRVRPLFQAIPVPSATCRANGIDLSSEVRALEDFKEDDWRRYHETYDLRNSGRPGDYARRAKKLSLRPVAGAASEDDS